MSRMTGSASLALELDYARGYYEAVTALSSEHLPVLPQTWIRLLGRMVSGTSVHFRGEPLKGLQIMGPLETRALDFENLVILSCNEGVFPRHSVAASYIPHELRKAFGLPTYEYQDAIWAYYFYRLIQRSRRVWLVYDSRMEGVRSGEESRYIKQLEMHFGVSLNRYVAKAPMTQASLDGDIPKTAGDVDKIRRTKLSASSLRNYLECPARFYFSKVQGLRSVDEVTEDLDDGMIGNVYHETMQELYTTGDGLVTRRYLESVSRDQVKELVRKHICAQLKTFEVTGRNLVFEHMICEYVQKTLQRDIELMRDRGVDAFRIIGLELERDFEFKGFKFTGKIDRMDSFIDGTLRVVDYKTGTVIRDDTEIDDYNAEDIVHKIFDPATKSSYRPKVAFQVYIYDVIASEMYPGASVVNSIYRPADLFRDKVAERPLNRKFYDCMTLALSSLLEEMVSLEIPFSRTSDTDRCKYCDFKMICGR